MQVVRWGRSVYANIQKFIQFQLTVNVAALIINVVAAVSSGNVPLNAVQVSDLSSVILTFLNDVLYVYLCVSARICMLMSLVSFRLAPLGQSHHGYSWSTGVGY